MTEFRLVVSDFDGAWTDVEAEGVPFWPYYFTSLAAHLGQPSDHIIARAGKLERTALAQPLAHPFIVAGHVAAPGTVDPYLRARSAAQRILQDAGRPHDDADALTLLNRLFGESYLHTWTIFRSDAIETLRALLEIPVQFVSNSDTANVIAKLTHLITSDRRHTRGLDLYTKRVHGNARKFNIATDATIPCAATLTIPGIPWSIPLHRPYYFRILDQLRIEHGAEWKQVLVFGDIAQLDLCLPLALGCHVVLIANRYTPVAERRFIADHPRGRVIESLVELPPLVHHWD